MRIRLAALALIAIGMAPGTWVRSPPKPALANAPLIFTPIEFAPLRRGEVAVEAVWQLTSANRYFGSYSGLTAINSNHLLAVGDKGGWLRFAVPGTGDAARFGALGRAAQRRKSAVDAEAVEYDPATGQAWVAYEVSNSIERSGMNFTDVTAVRPAAMKNWPITNGPESMARLPDGRFIVIGEGSPDWTGTGMPGLLFAGDPVDDPAVTRFGIETPAGYRATDLAALPDGRVLILMRRIAAFFPPAFTAKIAVADPAQIVAGEVWPMRVIATLGTDLPHDNFEGLAAIPRDDGDFTLWLISDDNGAALQETLLYRLRWTPSAR